MLSRAGASLLTHWEHERPSQNEQCVTSGPGHASTQRALTYAQAHGAFVCGA